MTMTREEIEARAKQRRLETVEVEGLGKQNLLRLSGNQAKELAEYQDKLLSQDQRTQAYMDLRIRIVGMCWVDDNLKRLYGDDELDALGDLPNDDIANLAEEALRINGMGAKAAEEISGKSATSRSGDETSSSA